MEKLGVDCGGEVNLHGRVSTMLLVDSALGKLATDTSKHADEPIHGGTRHSWQRISRAEASPLEHTKEAQSL